MKINWMEYILFRRQGGLSGIEKDARIQTFVFKGLEKKTQEKHNIFTN